MSFYEVSERLRYHTSIKFRSGVFGPNAKKKQQSTMQNQNNNLNTEATLAAELCDSCYLQDLGHKVMIMSKLNLNLHQILHAAHEFGVARDENFSGDIGSPIKLIVIAQFRQENCSESAWN